MPPRPPATGCVLWLHDIGEVNAREITEYVQQHICWCGVSVPSAERRELVVDGGETQRVPSWFEEARLPVRGGEPRKLPTNLAEAIKLVAAGHAISDARRDTHPPAARVAADTCMHMHAPSL